MGRPLCVKGPTLCICVKCGARPARRCRFKMRTPHHRGVGKEASKAGMGEGIASMPDPSIYLHLVLAVLMRTSCSESCIGELAASRVRRRRTALPSAIPRLDIGLGCGTYQASAYKVCMHALPIVIRAGTRCVHHRLTQFSPAWAVDVELYRLF